jgi:ribosomal protein L11 methyltransferase
LIEYYYELQIKPYDRYDIFASLLLDLTHEAIEEKNEMIISRSQNQLDNIEYGIKEFAKSMNIKCETKILKLKNEDWINKYKNSIQPLKIDKFFIHPSWIENSKENINIIVDPALAFGSGHHETTSSCIKAINKYIKPNKTLLDVGCGSGILGICAAKLKAIVDICDTDELAITKAQQNFDKSSTNINQSWIGSVNETTKKYDIIVANIVSDILVIISNDLKRSLKNNGILIISGILDKYKNKVLEKYQDMTKIEEIDKNEWSTIILQNKRNINE